MKTFTIQVGEVFTDQKARELKEYLELKDADMVEERQRLREICLKKGCNCDTIEQ